MKKRKRNYKCPLCNKIITRVSDKKWIKSDCVEAGEKTTRLILIQKKNGKTNNI